MNRFFVLTLVVLLAVEVTPMARAQVYVAYTNSGVISEYDADTGASINEMFVLGLKGPRSVCLANGLLYVAQTDSGYIGTYDAKTGRPVRPEFIGGLNMPQAMTVAGDAIYVSDFNWETHMPRIGKYDAFTGAAINADLVTLPGTVFNGTTYPGPAPTCLAVLENKIFVSLENNAPGGLAFDATTGARLAAHYAQFLTSANDMMTSGHWLWTSLGYDVRGGCIFKIDLKAALNEFGPDRLRPLIPSISKPTWMAISGDDLFVGVGGGTAIGKYNATSGAVINANFIPSLHDRLGGLAVVQRDLTADEVSADASYDWQQSLSHFAFMAMLHENSLVTGAGVVFALGMAVLVALLFRQKAAVPVGTSNEIATSEPMVQEEAAFAPEAHTLETDGPKMAEDSPMTADAVVDGLPGPVDPPVTRARSFSTLAIVASVLGVTTLAAFAVMGYLVMQPLVPSSFPTQDPEANLIGAWEFDNSGVHQGHVEPVLRSLLVYPDHAEYSDGAGSLPQTGTWHDNGFWIKNADGSAETEVVRLLDPLNVEVHVNAFIATRSDVEVLYKVEGSATEKQAIAAKYPGPITYPPPKAIITYFMSEYDLRTLPWRPDYLTNNPEDDFYSQGIIYHFHSDNPKVPALDVTLKNRRVVKISGGYE